MAFSAFENNELLRIINNCHMGNILFLFVVEFCNVVYLYWKIEANAFNVTNDWKIYCNMSVLEILWLSFTCDHKLRSRSESCLCFYFFAKYKRTFTFVICSSTLVRLALGIKFNIYVNKQPWTIFALTVCSRNAKVPNNWLSQSWIDHLPLQTHTIVVGTSVPHPYLQLDV